MINPKIPIRGLFCNNSIYIPSHRHRLRIKFRLRNLRVCSSKSRNNQIKYCGVIRKQPKNLRELLKIDPIIQESNLAKENESLRKLICQQTTTIELQQSVQQQMQILIDEYTRENPTLRRFIFPKN